MTTTPRQTLRISQPTDLVAAMPYLLGFTPTDSLVVASIAGEGSSRLDCTSRIDLDAAIQDPVEVMRHLASRPGPAECRAIVLVYAGDDTTMDWVEDLFRTGEAVGLPVIGAWQVTESWYRELDPAPGFWERLPDPTTTAVAATFVAQGRSPVAHRSALLPDLTPDPERTDFVAAMMNGTGRLTTAVRKRAILAWVHALQEQTMTTAAAGLVHCGLRSLLVRDAVLASCMGLPERDTIHSALSRDAASRHLGLIMAPDGAIPPDPARAALVTALLADLVRCAPAGRGSEPLAILAWSAWWTGDGATANQYLDLLLAGDPKHRLGGLLRAGLLHGLRPGWVDAAA